LVYIRDDLTLRGALLFIKKLGQSFAKLKLNKEWIEVYLRAEALQNKFKLDLPLRNILTTEGLLLDTEIVDNLFH
jgi:hypothetical protein